MPAKTKKQREFFRLVKAVQQGRVDPSAVNSEVRGAAASMTVAQVKDFAVMKRKAKRKKRRRS